MSIGWPTCWPGLLSAMSEGCWLIWRWDCILFLFIIFFKAETLELWWQVITILRHHLGQWRTYYQACAWSKEFLFEDTVLFHTETQRTQECTGCFLLSWIIFNSFLNYKPYSQIATKNEKLLQKLRNTILDEVNSLILFLYQL